MSGKPAGVSRILMQGFRFIFFIVSTNLNATYCTCSSPLISHSSLNNCSLITSVNCRKLKLTQLKSRSHPTNRRCSCRSVHALANENAPAQHLKTGPSGRAKLWMISFNLNFFSDETEAKPQDQMHWNQPARFVHPIVDEARLKSNLFIQDVSLLCCQARCCRFLKN